MKPALDEYHDEVVAALRELGDPRLGAAVAKDRGSDLEHLGIRFPALRKRVKQGFSFLGPARERDARSLGPPLADLALRRRALRGP